MVASNQLYCEIKEDWSECRLINFKTVIFETTIAITTIIILWLPSHGSPVTFVQQALGDHMQTEQAEAVLSVT